MTSVAQGPKLFFKFGRESHDLNSKHAIVGRSGKRIHLGNAYLLARLIPRKTGFRKRRSLGHDWNAGPQAQGPLF